MSDQKKLHVIYIITQLELGGAQKVCLSLLKAFHAQGVNVSLISGSKGPLVEQITSFKSVYLLESFKNELNLKNIKNDVVTFFKLIKIIKKIKKKIHIALFIHTVLKQVFSVDGLLFLLA